MLQSRTLATNDEIKMPRVAKRLCEAFPTQPEARPLDYSALCYATFPGSYYSAKGAAKLEPWIAGTFLRAGEVSSTTEVAAEITGVRCIILRAVSDLRSNLRFI